MFRARVVDARMRRHLSVLVLVFKPVAEGASPRVGRAFAFGAAFELHLANQTLVQPLRKSASSGTYPSVVPDVQGRARGRLGYPVSRARATALTRASSLRVVSCVRCRRVR